MTLKVWMFLLTGIIGFGQLVSLVVVSVANIR